MDVVKQRAAFGPLTLLMGVPVPIVARLQFTGDDCEMNKFDDMMGYLKVAVGALCLWWAISAQEQGVDQMLRLVKSVRRER